MALSDLTVEQFNEACRTWIRNGKFFPRPAELLELVHGTVEDQAERAWQLAEKEAVRVGHRRAPAIDCPATRSAIASVGGWERFCSTTDREAVFQKKAFTEAFKAFARSGSKDAPPLLGELDRANGRIGYTGPQQVGLVVHKVGG